MKILFASTEVAPFSKAGGLGDVAGSLPKELVKLNKDIQISIFTVLHGCIDKKKYKISEVNHSNLQITFGGCPQMFKLYKTCLPDTNIDVFFVDSPWYFGCFNEVYPKWLNERYEHERYIAFSQAVLEYAKMIGFKPDIIHSNDWHTAIIPTLLRSNYDMDDFYKNTKNVFSIHNLAYQGVTEPSILDFANMQKHRVFHHLGIEHFGKVNWMKGAINFSDKIIVVSPKYRDEILSCEFGEGMDFTLRGAAYKIEGILNGIDYSIFNPKTDKLISYNYDINSLENKINNKKEVLREFSLEFDENKPLIALISRLVDQKGISLIKDMENVLKRMDMQLIVLGSGDKDFENLFIWLSNNTNNIRARIDYREDIAHKLYAASDMFLMPSKFEPCGLGQLIAMKYGSIPIVRATGGLDNTVTGYPLDNSNGFKFWRFNGYDMIDAINCARKVFLDKYTFRAMIKSAMSAEFSWEKSSKEYISIYKNLIYNS